MVRRIDITWPDGGDDSWTDVGPAGAILRTEFLGPTYTLAAEPGFVGIAGSAAILKYELATSGAVGAAAPLPSLSTLLEPTTVGYTLTAEATSFALSGQAASLLRGALVTGSAGAFSVAGQAATLKVGRKVAGDAGSFSLAGQPATLVRTGAYSLSAEAVAFALTGNDAGLTRGTAAPDVPEGGGALWSLPPMRKRRPEPEWDEESDDAGVLVAVGIL